MRLHCLIPAKFPCVNSPWTVTGADADKENSRNNTVGQWVRENFPFMLGQQKCYVQVKYVTYNAVRQMCSKSPTLLGRCNVIICSMFLRCDFYVYCLLYSRQCDKKVWQFKNYLYRVKCKIIMKSFQAYFNLLRAGVGKPGAQCGLIWTTLLRGTRDLKVQGYS